jgi:CheY-like chemotaxis protein
MNEGTKKILILEDEPDVVTYLTALFEDHGYATESARNGQEGMEKAKAAPPDLITLDMSMPEKSGVRFYREIKDDPVLSKIPVVVVTGVTGYGGNPDDFRRFLETRRQVPPPDAFMAKPVDREELLRVVRALLTRTT